jgi:hypothetical protein
MSESNGCHQFDAHFYEVAVDKNSRRGLGSDKQAFLVVLGINTYNNFLTFVLSKTIKVDNQSNINRIFDQQVKLNRDKTLTTDGKTTFYNLRDKINLNSVKINYKKPINHSDQGVHYTSPRYQNLVKGLNIQQSISRKGNCWDNAPQESFFGHMKQEIKSVSKIMKK